MGRCRTTRLREGPEADVELREDPEADEELGAAEQEGGRESPEVSVDAVTARSSEARLLRKPMCSMIMVSTRRAWAQMSSSEAGDVAATYIFLM